MKRLGFAALSVATIVVAWIVVRGRVDDASRPSGEMATTHDERVARSAAARPTLVRETRPGNDAAFRSALATLERDMADGRWSLDDRDRLAAAVMPLRGEQATELYLMLFPKLNDGTIVSEIEGPPI